MNLYFLIFNFEKKAKKQKENQPMPTVRVNLIRACNLVAGDKNGKSDPYVILQSSEDKKKKFKSKIKKKTLDPIWNEVKKKYDFIFVFYFCISLKQKYKLFVFGKNNSIQFFFRKKKKKIL